MVASVNILKVKVDKVTMKAAKKKVENILEENNYGRMVVTPNSEMVIRARTDYELRRILNQADLAIPDGAGVVLASRILKNSLEERVTGFDLMQEIFSLVNNTEYRIYLLGGEPGIAEQARKKLKEQYKELNICGCYHGYLDQEKEDRVIGEINDLKPDILFVGMGVPLQEKFLDKNLNNLKVKLAMTVGGSFDILAGKNSRAPLWIQKYYLEWFYRLIKEPSRLGRMLTLPRFVFLVLLQAFQKVLD